MLLFSDGQDLSDSSTSEPGDVPASVRDALNRRVSIWIFDVIKEL